MLFADHLEPAAPVFEPVVRLDPPPSAGSAGDGTLRQDPIGNHVRYFHRASEPYDTSLKRNDHWWLAGRGDDLSFGAPVIATEATKHDFQSSIDQYTFHSFVSYIHTRFLSSNGHAAAPTAARAAPRARTCFQRRAGFRLVFDAAVHVSNCNRNDEFRSSNCKAAKQEQISALSSARTGHT